MLIEITILGVDSSVRARPKLVPDWDRKITLNTDRIDKIKEDFHHKGSYKVEYYDKSSYLISEDDKNRLIEASYK